jgi:hypothetical protein
MAPTIKTILFQCLISRHLLPLITAELLQQQKRDTEKEKAPKVQGRVQEARHQSVQIAVKREHGRYLTSLTTIWVLIRRLVCQNGRARLHCYHYVGNGVSDNIRKFLWEGLPGTLTEATVTLTSHRVWEVERRRNHWWHLGGFNWNKLRPCI